MLASDAEGVGTWQPVKPMSSIVEGKLNDYFDHRQTVGDGNSGFVNITLTKDGSKPNGYITLNKGKWLIMAKFTTVRSNVASSYDRSRATGLYTYAQLRFTKNSNIFDTNDLAYPIANSEAAITIGRLVDNPRLGEKQGLVLQLIKGIVMQLLLFFIMMS